jgi:Uncharacterised nucleotidyltransferase
MAYVNPEIQLILRCLSMQIYPKADDQDNIQKLAGTLRDWDYIKSLCVSHRIIPHFWKSISRIEAGSVPVKFSQELEHASLEIRKQCLLNVHELRRLSLLFKAENVDILCYKGYSLARFYENISYRQWGDIDLIVRKTDLPKVTTLLTSIGYRQKDRESRINKLLKKEHSFTFINLEGTVEVDIHWQLGDEKENIRLRVEELWRQHTQQRLFDIDLPVPDTEHLILSTCMHHGLRENWNSLKKICDIALIIKNCQQLDWKHLLSAAKEMNVKRPLLVGASLAKQLFYMPIPIPLEDAIKKDKSIEQLRTWIYNQLFASHEIARGFLFTQLIKFKMEQQWNGKIQIAGQIVSFTLKPNRKDERFFRLPYKFYFLYYFLRPIRLACLSYKYLLSYVKYFR